MSCRLTVAAVYVLLITEVSRADELAAYADDDMEFAESVHHSVCSRAIG